MKENIEVAENTSSNVHVYLVDTENVKMAWTVLLDRVTEEDKIILFYTEHSNHLTYQDLQFIMRHQDKLTFISCTMGTNALDFQLSTCLGYMVAEYKDAKFHIISDDKGYNAIINFWQQRKKNVTRIGCSGLEGWCNHLDIKKQVANHRKLVEARYDILHNYNSEEVNKNISKYILDGNIRFGEKEVKSVNILGQNILIRTLGQVFTAEEDAAASIADPAPTFEPNNVSYIHEGLEENKYPSILSAVGEVTPRANFLKKILPKLKPIEIANIEHILNSYKEEELARIYEALTHYLGQEEGIQIYRSLKGHVKDYYVITTHAVSEQVKEERQHVVDLYIENATSKEKSTVCKILNNYELKDKLAIHNELVKEFGMTKGSSYYALIKNHLNEFYNEKPVADQNVIDFKNCAQLNA